MPFGFHSLGWFITVRSIKGQNGNSRLGKSCINWNAYALNQKEEAEEEEEGLKLLSPDIRDRESKLFLSFFPFKQKKAFWKGRKIPVGNAER